MSFNYDHEKGKHQENFWTSYADLYMTMFTIFLFIYVGSTLKQGTRSFEQSQDKQMLKNQIADLQQQLKVYENLKDDHIKQADPDEAKLYEDLMGKLDLLQDEAKDEKEALRRKAMETELKEKALNKYQQLIRNMINSNVLAKTKIQRRNEIITKKEDIIEEKDESIAALEQNVEQQRNDLAAKEQQITQSNAELQNNIKKLEQSYKANQMTKKELETKITKLRHAAYAEVANIKNQAEVIRQELEGAQSDLQNTQARLGQTQSTLAKTKGQLASAEQENTQLEGTLEATKNKYAGDLAKERGKYEGELAKERGKYEDELGKLKGNLADARAKFEGDLAKERGKYDDEMGKLKGAHDAALGNARKGFADALAKEKLSAAEKGKKEAAFREAMADKEKGYQDQLGKLKDKYDNTQGELKKAIDQINTKKKLADQIRNRFKRAGIDVDINEKTGEVVLDFKNSYFNTGSAELKKEMIATLQKFIPIYTAGLFEDAKTAEKIASVEIIGFASPTYKGKLVDPSSLDPANRSAVNFNLDLSFNRAKSIFGYIFDVNKMQYNEQKRLLGLVKVTGRSFLAQGTDKTNSDASADNFCSAHDCKKEQRVVIKFNLKD
jgi:chromosome segregation ATPase